jgi:tetratricopeptide (TPR) repeat protein
MADLQQIVKSQPNDIVAVTRLAALYEKEGSVANAAEMYEKALQLNPKLLEPLVKLAQMYSGPLNDAAKASEYAKRARDIAPNDPTVSALAGRISYQSGNFTRAYSLLQETARRENPDAATLHAYAWAAYSIGKVDEAVEAMDKALAANPDAKTTEDAKLFLTLVRLAANPQSIAGANADVQRALQSDPNYVPALVLQGELQLQRNDATGAMVTYNKILARFPEFAPVQKRLAALYLQDQDELEKAFDLANSARRTLPNDVELSQILGRIYYERKEYNRAIQLLQESAKQQPLDALSLFALGMAQAEVKQSRAARESLAKAVAAGLPEPKAAEANRRAAELEGM